ncbi:MAG: hypothetical protein V1797_18820 [Pseudomonadota bacterium]
MVDKPSAIMGFLGRLLPAGLAVALVLLGGCTHLSQPAAEPGPRLFLPAASPAPAPDLDLARRFAPAFLVYNPHQAHNLIGQPRAELDAKGWEQISVDPARAVIYWQQREFATARGAYTNLIYRVHFPATPYSLAPFFIGAGRNMGLMVVVTLDAARRPVLVTTLGTCGCYVALAPTSRLPAAARPAGWTGEPQQIYGETLPARLDYAGLKAPRLVVGVRPGEHRVMSLMVAEEAALTRHPDRVAADLAPAEDLTRLPLPGGGRTSFYHQSGLLAGHVKGAWKPWETLLLGVVSLDGLVGMDKAYAGTGNPFYTSLKPWARRDSDLWDFPRFLQYWGWRL